MLKVLSFSKRKIKTFAQTISATTAMLVILALTATTGFVSVWARNVDWYVWTRYFSWHGQ